MEDETIACFVIQLVGREATKSTIFYCNRMSGKWEKFFSIKTLLSTPRKKQQTNCYLNKWNNYAKQMRKEINAFYLFLITDGWESFQHFVFVLLTLTIQSWDFSFTDIDTTRVNSWTGFLVFAYILIRDCSYFGWRSLKKASARKTSLIDLLSFKLMEWDCCCKGEKGESGIIADGFSKSFS